MARTLPNARPARDWHDAVVDDVEERHLPELLPSHEAELKEVNELVPNLGGLA